MARGISVGSAYVTILPSARGFTKNLRKELSGELEVLAKNTGKSLEDGVRKAKLGDAFRSALKGIQFAGAITGIAALGSAAVTLGSALLPLGGLLTALPAAALGAGAAFTVLSLALGGVGKALKAGMSGDMEKFEEELKNLTPSAQTAARALVKFSKGLKESAQESFFAPIANDLEKMSQKLNGPLKKGIGDVGNSMGKLAEQALKFVNSSKGVSLVKDTFKATGKFIDGAASGVKPLLKGIADLASVFFPTFASAGNSVGDLMAKFGKWLSAIAKGGQAFKWFDNAKAVAGKLWQVAKNLLSTLLSIFKASDSGGDMLGTIVSLTASMAAWTASAEGQEKMGDIFQLLGEVLSHLITILPVVAGGLGAIASVVAGMPDGLRGVVTWVLAFGAAASLLSGPIAGVITGLGLAATGVTKIKGMLPDAIAWVQLYAESFVAWSKKMAKSVGSAIATGARWVATTVAQGAKVAASWAVNAGKAIASGAKWVATTVVQGAKIAATWVATAARAVAAGAVWVARATIQFAFLIARWVALGAAAVAQGARIVAGWVMQGVAMIPVIAAAVVNFAIMIAGWVALGIAALINGAKIAAGWLLAMGPLGLLVAAVIAIVALVIIYWDEIVAVFDGAVAGIRDALAWFEGLGAMAADWIGGMVSAFTTKWGEVMDFFGSIPGEVGGAMLGAGKWLVSAGGDILQGLLNGMMNAAGAVWDWITGLLSGIKDQVLSFFGIASPSKLMTYYGEMIGMGLVKGIGSMEKQAARAAAGLASAAKPEISTNFKMAAEAAILPDENRRVLSDEDVERMAEAMASRPTVVKVGEETIATAADAGNRKLARRR